MGANQGCSAGLRGILAVHSDETREDEAAHPDKMGVRIGNFLDSAEDWDCEVLRGTTRGLEDLHFMWGIANLENVESLIQGMLPLEEPLKEPLEVNLDDESCELPQHHSPPREVRRSTRISINSHQRLREPSNYRRWTQKEEVAVVEGFFKHKRQWAQIHRQNPTLKRFNSCDIKLKAYRMKLGNGNTGHSK